MKTIKFGDVFYSEFFKSRGVVVEYLNEYKWSFVLESRPSQILTAQSTPNNLKWEGDEE
jgi:hypothetical protein